MKRFIAFFLVLVLMLGCGAALAEEEKSPEEFVFREKIKWNMSQDEVMALEGEPNSSLDTDLLDTISYSNVQVSSYKGSLGYVFLNDRLIMTGYSIIDAEQEDYEELRTALTTVYGDEAEPDPNGLLGVINKSIEEKMTEYDLRGFSISKWERPDGTQIYLYFKEYYLSILYVSPEYLRWEPDAVNTTGL